MFKLVINEEIWKPVVGYEGFYEVSNKGNVRSISRYVKTCGGAFKFWKGKILKGVKFYPGYRKVSLSKLGEAKDYDIHRLVAEAFIPNPNNLPQVDHIIPVINGGKDNVENLRWVSAKDNANNHISLKNRSEAQLKVSEKKSKSMMGKCVKHLMQFDRQMNLVKVFSGKSISETCKELGYNINTIYGSTHNPKRTAYGYYWRSYK